MPFNELLADRIRQALARQKGVTEKTLFGCFCLLLHGNVCVGVWKQALLVRVGADEYADALKEPYTREFDITGTCSLQIQQQPGSAESTGVVKGSSSRKVRRSHTLRDGGGARTTGVLGSLTATRLHRVEP